VTRAARALAASGAGIVDVEERFPGLSSAQRTVMAAEGAASLGPLRIAHGDRLSPELRAILDEGDAVSPAALAAARVLAAEARARLPALFGRFDVLLGASTPGEAPAGLASTGDPALNRIWTLLGVPCVQLPAGRGPSGMPVGIQLVGPPGGEATLCAAAVFAERSLLAAGLGPTFPS
jgi:Asp-tRNA(Asn)/Glu-tRNA(Gln) amidotransferase A subunit family amidase